MSEIALALRGVVQAAVQVVRGARNSLTCRLRGHDAPDRWGLCDRCGTDLR